MDTRSPEGRQEGDRGEGEQGEEGMSRAARGSTEGVSSAKVYPMNEIDS